MKAHLHLYLSSHPRNQDTSNSLWPKLACTVHKGGNFKKWSFLKNYDTERWMMFGTKF